MENLRIAGTKDTLAVDFDAGTGMLVLEGISYPENPVDFFSPLTDWLNTYIEEIQGILTVKITITYLNTSSAKCLLDFLEKLEGYHQSGAEVSLNWYYEEGDEDMLETGEELCEDLELPCALTPL